MEWVGHPAAETVRPTMSPEEAYQHYHLDPERARFLPSPPAAARKSCRACCRCWRRRDWSSSANSRRAVPHSRRLLGPRRRGPRGAQGSRPGGDPARRDGIQRPPTRAGRGGLLRDGDAGIRLPPHPHDRRLQPHPLRGVAIPRSAPSAPAESTSACPTSSPAAKSSRNFSARTLPPRPSPRRLARFVTDGAARDQIRATSTKCREALGGPGASDGRRRWCSKPSRPEGGLRRETDFFSPIPRCFGARPRNSG